MALRRGGRGGGGEGRTQLREGREERRGLGGGVYGHPLRGREFRCKMIVKFGRLRLRWRHRWCWVDWVCSRHVFEAAVLYPPLQADVYGGWTVSWNPPCSLVAL
jgi:hypothetical protein